MKVNEFSLRAVQTPFQYFVHNPLDTAVGKKTSVYFTLVKTKIEHIIDLKRKVISLTLLCFSYDSSD